MIRVLIVDDSTLIREVFQSVLYGDPEIEVVGQARDGREGVAMALELKPDVITMDLNMPSMDGFAAIREIMVDEPVPVIVVSGMDSALLKKALDFGAMDFVSIGNDIDKIAADLIGKIKIAARARPIKQIKSVKPEPSIPSLSPLITPGLRPVVAIGVSTGGPQSLQVILSGLPSDFPAGILIVQHMTEGFITGLAEWLNAASQLEIKVARTGDLLRPGRVLFAPDGSHIRLDSDFIISLSEAPDDSSGHIPSIDVMMKSVADSYGPRAVGVIMTGMGRDGVRGIEAIKKNGGITIAQNEESSVIFGMNKEAIKTGSVDVVLPLDRIAGELIRICRTQIHTDVNTDPHRSPRLGGVAVHEFLPPDDQRSFCGDTNLH